MKRFLLSVVLATSLALTSCQFDDSDIWDKFGEMEESIRDHEKRISALEELCKQMNTNIEALQTIVAALEKRDYVTNVSEVRSNGEVIGYTISFAYSNTITIYHGKDGKDGINGKDGYTPQIGVMKDTDGIYYWTLDGEWLLDGKGNKIQANGVNGSNGTNGSNGIDGVDGITPQLKIENDYWFISYDNGVTWQQLGKATGEDGTDGNDGIDGEDGDSIFSSVTQDDEYVYFNLSDGTMITLPKHDKENIQFEDLQVKAICCKNWDTNNDGELSYAEAAAVETIGTVFSGNTNIIAFTELKYFTGITEIPANAFEGCTALWKVKIPEQTAFIGTYAFKGTKNLTNITIPNQMTSIGEYAFSNCFITNLFIPDNITSIGERAFESCASLTSVTIPDSVTEIGDYAFCDCSSLPNISIPNSVTSIGERGFYGCTSLTSATIGNSVTSIGVCAFCNCTSLASITIPDSVTSIEENAFGKCTSLLYIYCKPLVPPAIYYNYKYSISSTGCFPNNLGMIIYVPRDSYDAYMQYETWSPGGVSSYNGVYDDNWAWYESRIEPYDFE